MMDALIDDSQPVQLKIIRRFSAQYCYVLTTTPIVDKEQRSFLYYDYVLRFYLTQATRFRALTQNSNDDECDISTSGQRPGSKGAT